MNELRKIYANNFFSKSVTDANQETMIATEKERPNEILKQLLMKNPDSLKLRSQENELEGKSGVHGLDILCGLMILCEHNAREIIIQNLMVCLLATPLVLPTLEMMVYPYQNKSKSWDEWQLNQRKEYAKVNMQANIFTHKAPVISFIRACDNCNVNKSELINSLFCNVNSPSSVSHNDTSTYHDKQLAKGMIEMTHFCPEYEEHSDNQINEMLTILNLRGNAHEFPKQVQFLKQVSDLVVVVGNSNVDFVKKIFVLANKDDRNFLWVGTHNDAVTLPIGKTIINNKRFLQLESRSNSNQLDAIKAYIATFVESNTQSLKRMSLQEMSSLVSKSEKLSLDMDTLELLKAKDLAEKFKDLSETKSKKQIVPLQGEDLWGKISENNKKRNKLSSERISYQEVLRINNHLEQEISEKRLKQMQIAC